MSSQNSLANASLSSNTIGASSTNSAVRSRPRRLVSLMDDEDATTSSNNHYAYQDSQPFTSGLSTTLLPEGTTRSRGATPSPLSSRGASPLPMKHPSRVTESANRSRNELASFGLNGSSKPARGTTDFLDSPWSSLQNLASSVLGSNIGRDAADNSTKAHSRRKPSRSDLYIRSIPRSTPSTSTWGPLAPASPEIGSGTKEERQALVQAKKREALLLADSDPIASRNFQHKKRYSGDFSDQAIDPDHDEDALAYVHRVQTTDSITGVTIKYGCQAAVFRKANGFWPNDNIQSRSIVLLPVDACSVKGRPIRQEETGDLVRPNSEDGTGSCIRPTDSLPDSPKNQNTSGNTESDSNQIWRHESWVQIDGFPAAIEIGRVPRRALGFFPRTRRKSVSYTDSEPVSATSSQGPASSPAFSGSPQLDLSQSALPRIRPRDGETPKPAGQRPTRPQHRRQRSSIHLSGTGVGTLDRTSTAPGPALDGLSKFFSQHMPQLAPPAPSQDPRRPSFGSESTVVSNASTGLENIGGALEGWVRKVASRAKVGLSDMQGSSTPPKTGRGRSPGLWGMADLIELDDASEGRRSPSVMGTSRRQAQASSSSSSSFRPTASASTTSRSRALGSGSGDRVKDD
ncbi:hypothetical protein N7493_003105 [Penicillium malachiteum]|uniref:LysM domain-containing protein n=1 Tax=Penicillium malachiteum TaxID=1324776 RepID=A0AAD6MZA6_9EURO|nr:hypothetical protein N7493_003105 [Penicillium malachiteum]